MRTKPATRYDKETYHAQYGIVNWFKGKGIYDLDVIKECMYVFCENYNFDMSKIKKEEKVSVWIQNRFSIFKSFVVKYLKENNYTK